MESKGKGRGGARPGSGRPKLVQDPVKLAVEFERPDVEALRALAEKRGASLADLLRRALRQYLGRAAPRSPRGSRKEG